jgi:predicted transcriptional regulator of viral defense system
MTPRQTILFQILGDNGWDIFNREMLLGDGRLNNDEITRALRYLLNQGEIISVERGKYRRNHFRDEKVIGCFMADGGAIAYWSALNLHGLTEQFPNELMIQNRSRTGVRQIPGMGTVCRFIKVLPNKMTGLTSQGFGNHVFRLTNVEKTIVDCFDLPQYSGGYPELIKGFAKAQLNVNRMISYSKANGNLSVIKRIAFLYDLLMKPGYDIYGNYATGEINARYVSFDPSLPAKGIFLAKYRLILNLSEEDIREMANPLRS